MRQYPALRPNMGMLFFPDEPAPDEEASSSIFDFLRPEEAKALPPRQREQRTSAPRESKRNLFFPEPTGPRESLFSFLKPKDEAKGNLFFKPQKPIGGDPFSAARERPVGGDPFSAASGDPFSRAASRNQETFARKSGYESPAFMSGPGQSTGLLENPAFWLIAGLGVFIALETAGITHLSK